MDDIFALDAGSAEAQPLTILHPTKGEPLGEKDKPMRVFLLSADSPKYRAKVTQFLLNKEDGQRGDDEDEEVYAVRISDGGIKKTAELLAAVTTGWENVIAEGKEFKFSKANAVKAYSQLPWLRQQVEEFVGDRANFISPGSKT